MNTCDDTKKRKINLSLLQQASDDYTFPFKFDMVFFIPSSLYWKILLDIDIVQFLVHYFILQTRGLLFRESFLIRSDSGEALFTMNCLFNKKSSKSEFRKFSGRWSDATLIRQP
jgi:hypothetical protein